MEQALLDSLTQRGMLEKEAVMYLTTLELGNAPASSIARKANIKRTTCYSILRDFEQRGIATSIMRKEIAYFSVVDPEILLKQLEDKYLTFKNNIPELQALQAAAHSKLKIQYYE
jgi:sugar-specific transcriptional regulator TrmB